MEDELARETRSRHDLKLGRGGLTDVETAVQYLQLRHAASHPELLDPEPTAVQLDRLEAAGLLDGETAATLREGLLFLKRLSSRVRIVENRSISDLDQERGDLEALGRSLGYGPGGREGGARRALLKDYRQRTDAVREAYRRILSAPGEAR
jgi:glutamate-ammonia-ligase adenylyltransferase